MNTNTIPPRSAVPVEYTWDLSKLYPSDSAWNDGLAVYEKMIEKIESYRGTLGRSAATLADWLDFYKEMGMLEERLAYYCELRQTEDEGASEARTMTGRFAMAQARSQAAASWAVPEIQAIPDSSIQSFLQHERLANIAYTCRNCSAETLHFKRQGRTPVSPPCGGRIGPPGRLFGADQCGYRFWHHRHPRRPPAPITIHLSSFMDKPTGTCASGPTRPLQTVRCPQDHPGSPVWRLGQTGWIKARIRDSHRPGHGPVP